MNRLPFRMLYLRPKPQRPQPKSGIQSQRQILSKSSTSIWNEGLRTLDAWSTENVLLSLCRADGETGLASLSDVKAIIFSGSPSSWGSPITQLNRHFNCSPFFNYLVCLFPSLPSGSVRLDCRESWFSHSKRIQDLEDLCAPVTTYQCTVDAVTWYIFLLSRLPATLCLVSHLFCLF